MRLTRDQIVAAGLQKAGNTSLSTPASTWFQAWLDGVACRHDWRHLKTRYGPYTLAQAATYFDFGDAAASPALTNGTTDDRIVRVVRVKLADVGNTGFKGDLLTENDNDQEANQDPFFRNTGISGSPSNCLIEPAAAATAYTNIFRWRLSFTNKTDKAYQIAIVAQKLPAALEAATVCWYPNDETAIEAVNQWALFHQDDERWPMVQASLEAKAKVDAVVFNRPHGSQKLQLSRRVFRRSGGGHIR